MVANKVHINRLTVVLLALPDLVTGERLIQQSAGEHWRQETWLLEGSEYSRAALELKCKDTLTRHAHTRVIHVEYLTSMDDSRAVVQPKRSYSSWVTARDYELGQSKEFAECLRLGPFEGLRVREMGDGVWVAQGALATGLTFGNVQARLAHFTVFDEAPKGTRRGEQLHAFFVVEQTSLAPASLGLWRASAELLPGAKVNVTVRSDPWFAIVDYFPLRSPIITPIKYPAESEWKRDTFRCLGASNEHGPTCNSILRSQ